MEREPRADKVAVVEEVREKLDGADAVIVTEYRGLTVGDLANLRNSMRAAGGEYKVYKNTLVRRAAAELDLDIAEYLVGPTALALVSGDVAQVAKALRDFAKANPLLVIKGGALGKSPIDAAGAAALASMPTASEIYSRLAGAINSGARGTAGALHGVHRSLAYVLQAAIDAGAFAGESASPADTPAATSTDDDTPAEAADNTEEN
jgi:large subunit ribosomal protein L10